LTAERAAMLAIHAQHSKNWQNLMNLLKNIFYNVGVVMLGLGLALLGTKLDGVLWIREFNSGFAASSGLVLLLAGFLLRVWTTSYFHARRMRVTSLRPQQALITSGPYRFTRNPHYLGGNVLIFFGAALMFGSPIAILIVAIHLFLLDLFIRREEKQLVQDFGEEWSRYRRRVRRWL
jgi:protein-S-isoprenylcysteine O-methyltransferase Ste14